MLCIWPACTILLKLNAEPCLRAMLCICRRNVADGTAPAACRWALWDEFQIVEASMYGYWNASAPIKIADGHDVLATSWVQHGTPDVLVAIGSWNAGTRDLLLP